MLFKSTQMTQITRILADIKICVYLLNLRHLRAKLLLKHTLIKLQ